MIGPVIRSGPPHSTGPFDTRGAPGGALSAQRVIFTGGIQGGIAGEGGPPTNTDVPVQSALVAIGVVGAA